MRQLSPIDVLKERYPWPATMSWPDQGVWNLGSRGLDLITDLIVSGKVRMLLEVGSFMGGSAKRWLDASRDVIVVAIDPWSGDWWTDYAAKHGRATLAARFAEPEGPLRAFTSALWAYRDRLVPMKGTSPAKLYELYELGVRPDLVYFDSNKRGDDFEIASDLFPATIIAGDDWTWGIQEGYPARQAVQALAEKRRLKIRVKGETWMLSNRLSATDLLHLSISYGRDTARWLKHKLSPG